MNRQHAQFERAGLQDLLDAYEASRLQHRAQDERLNRATTPDRAANIRARIARLDQLIGENGCATDDGSQ